MLKLIGIRYIAEVCCLLTHISEFRFVSRSLDNSPSAVSGGDWGGNCHTAGGAL